MSEGTRLIDIAVSKRDRPTLPKTSSVADANAEVGESTFAGSEDNVLHQSTLTFFLGLD
jgi:hypothetical protein